MQFRPNSVFGRRTGEKPIGQEGSAGIQGGVNAPPFCVHRDTKNIDKIQE